jgi:hypothetical protein
LATTGVLAKKITFSGQKFLDLVSDNCKKKDWTNLRTDKEMGVVFWLLGAYAPFILKYMFHIFQK